MPRSDEPLPSSSRPMRLQRLLAQCGLGSRRECEELITAGRVSIDGQTVTQLGTTVDPSRQRVSLDGERLKIERKKYYLLNKPSGFLCTARDPAGRRVVLDLFPDSGPRLFTVGRLDENTTGLLIVTNDGDLAQKLAHPRFRIFRRYRAQVAGQPTADIYEQLRTGLFFTEGKFRVHDVKPVKKQKGSTWVEITMTEGQNREIRRLFARVGHKIMKLERIGFGPLKLGRLSSGEFREMRREELAQLHALLQREPQQLSSSQAHTEFRPEDLPRRKGSPRGSAPARPGKTVSREPTSARGSLPVKKKPKFSSKRVGSPKREASASSEQRTKRVKPVKRGGPKRSGPKGKR